MRFFHYSDPQAKDYDPWHYCYLHGEAERFNEKQQINNDWEWAAPDLFVCDEPLNGPGRYEGNLYGRIVVMFVAYPPDRNWLCGRGAFPEDTVAYKHASKPEEWR